MPEAILSAGPGCRAPAADVGVRSPRKRFDFPNEKMQSHEGVGKSCSAFVGNRTYYAARVCAAGVCPRKSILRDVSSRSVLLLSSKNGVKRASKPRPATVATSGRLVVICLPEMLDNAFWWICMHCLQSTM